MELISSSPKFDVFRDGGEAVKVSKTDAAAEDLVRSVKWNTDIPLRLNDYGPLQIPGARIVLEDPVTARFEWLDGRIVDGDNLSGDLDLVAKGLTQLMGLKVDWQGSAGAWLGKRFSGTFTPVPLALGFSLEDVKDYLDLVEPGVLQGDWAPKNLLVMDGGRLGVLDAELGTHGLRPEYVMPRMHDAAYFYHLLYCQYHNSITADKFLTAVLGQELLEDDKAYLEFWLSVLERTSSMYKNFVLFPKEGYEVDNRRRDPEPYGILARRAMQMIRELGPEVLSVL